MKPNLAYSQDKPSRELREHYELEKGLASQLRNASREQRRHLYSSLYDQLYRQLPQHPRWLAHSSRDRVRPQLAFLKRFLNSDVVFLEIGAGDCALSLELAKFAKHVYAVDVSKEMATHSSAPNNFRFVLSDGCRIPIPSGEVNVAYSNQVMEHLHPDDAVEQLQSIHDLLVPGGRYFCVTPNRLTGPHDVSKYFDQVATGFHLREYTIGGLSALFRQSGFSKVNSYVGARGTYVRFPLLPLILCEKLLDRLPYAIRRPIANSLPVRMMLNIRLEGIK